MKETWDAIGSLESKTYLSRKDNGISYESFLFTFHIITIACYYLPAGKRPVPC